MAPRWSGNHWTPSFPDEEKEARSPSQRSARAEGDERSKGAPKRAGQQAGRERGDSDDEVVRSVGASALVRVNEVSDQRLLHWFSQPVEDPVHDEQRPNLPRGRCGAKTGVDQRVHEPSGRDQPSAREAIGQVPAQICAENFGQIQYRPKNGDVCGGEP